MKDTPDQLDGDEVLSHYHGMYREESRARSYYGDRATRRCDVIPTSVNTPDEAFMHGMQEDPLIFGALCSL